MIVVSKKGQVDFPAWVKVLGASQKRSVQMAAKRVIEKLRRAQKAAFTHGGHQEHGGRKWRALEPSTVRSKGHATILVRKGWMRNQVTFTSSVSITGRRVYFELNAGNRHAKAHMHQYGFRHGSHGLVKPRPPAWISEKDMADVRAALRDAFPAAPKMTPKKAKNARVRRRK